MAPWMVTASSFICVSSFTLLRHSSFSQSGAFLILCVNMATCYHSYECGSSTKLSFVIFASLLNLCYKYKYLFNNKLEHGATYQLYIHTAAESGTEPEQSVMIRLAGGGRDSPGVKLRNHSQYGKKNRNFDAGQVDSFIFQSADQEVSASRCVSLPLGSIKTLGQALTVITCRSLTFK